MSPEEWGQRAFDAMVAHEQRRAPVRKDHRPSRAVMNLAEPMRGQLHREREARSRLEQEIASIKANFAHALLELRNEMLADRLALERQHRAELERIIADGKQPDPEKSSAPSRLKLA